MALHGDGILCMDLNGNLVVSKRIVKRSFQIGACFALANDQRGTHLVLAGREFFGETAGDHH
jgi:hypothetical protein